ncbi:MAG: vWA domain-containing protein, partial [Acidimicrobiia bacterium]
GGNERSGCMEQGVEGQEVTKTAPVNLSVVLDRSGSMRSIASDMVGGFQAFIEEQRQAPGSARISLVQFDADDPFEVLIDGEDLQTARLDARKYLPRGLTPLLDAVGRMIARIDAGIAERSQLGLEEEDQVVLIITDGLENASKEYTLAAVKGLIEARRAAGWVFVFLGADQDSFAEGGRLGFSASNRRDWDKSAQGTKEMWDQVSKSSLAYRRKERFARMMEADEFLEDE